MDKHAFTTSSHVTRFTKWLAACHSTLSVKLDIKSSRFVPGGIRADLAGLDAVLQHYRWRTDIDKPGDLQETQQSLRELGDRLRQAIDGGNEDAGLAACRDILAWGGDRNMRVGALPFLTGLHGNGELTHYLREARKAFALDSAVIALDKPPVRKMNSMLTKVHALASVDGLPIYDSRVAAAIAALVELWRREARLEHEELPGELAFPATASDRSVLYLFGDAQDPGVMSYAPAKASETAARWSSAKIRLGWLMAGVLDKAPGLFATLAPQDRMRAFEASLFMIGSNVGCLVANKQRVLSAAAEPGVGQHNLLQAAGRQRLRQEHAGLPHKTISTLARDNNNLTYAGNTDSGISGIWGSTPFAFDSEFLQELLAEFSGSEAGLGASVDGNVQPDTLGFWIDEHYPAKPRKYASALAAILVEEGLAKRLPGTPVRLRFS